MKKLFTIIVISILSLGAVWPFFESGYFPMHDDTQVARVFAMGKALREGQFPVRWVSDLGYGYGYPIFNFYGPLPYYFGGLLAAFGLSALTATKAMFLVGTVLLGATTFILAASQWGRTAGILASTLALYAPYHAVQIFVRGAVGEFWASAFIPLVLLGCIDIMKAATRKRGIIVGAVGLAATILSHTITGYITVIMLLAGGLIYALICLVRKSIDFHVVRSGLGLFVLGLGLSAFFWLPAIVEMQYTAVHGQIGRSADFHTHFVCPAQLWESTWGFGGSIAGCIDGISFKLGKLHIIIAAIGIFLWLKLKHRGPLQLFFIATFLLIWSLLFATQSSVWLWELIPGYAYIQYPWRFLSGATLALALFSGSIGIHKRWITRVIIIPALVLAVIGVNGKWFRPNYLYPADPHTFETATELRFRASKVSDEYLPPEIVRPDNPEAIVLDTIMPGTGLSLSQNVDTAVYARYTVQAEQSQAVLIRRAYFPGWRYYLNTKPVEPLLVGGLPSILIPKGESIIELRFTDTPIRTAANLLSVAAVIWLFIYYVKTKKAHT